MYFIVKSFIIQGLTLFPVDVEVSISNGLPSISIIGMPGSNVKDSKERIKSALLNSGFSFPNKKITINLSPIELKKDVGYFDLPISIALLYLSQQISIKNNDLKDFVIAGELSLTGSVRAYKKLLILFNNHNYSNFILGNIPNQTIQKIPVYKDIKLVRLSHLKDLKNIDSFNKKLDSPNILNIKKTYKQYIKDSMQLKSTYPIYKNTDMKDVNGHRYAKRAIEIACSGWHNILLVGPPGIGKTMLLERVPGLLPEMSIKEFIETNQILSLSKIDNTEDIQMINKNNILSAINFNRPYRKPHHSSSRSAIIGGGINPLPGEVSLTNNGILYLDELAEFDKSVIESLREPLQDHKISISRAGYSVVYPASFLLLSSMNLCPCGNYSLNTKYKCTCSVIKRKNYYSKISNAVLDRISIKLILDKVDLSNIQINQNSFDNESSLDIQKRIEKAWKIQEDRYLNENIRFNSHIPDKLISKYCRLDKKSSVYLDFYMKNNKISHRSYVDILRLSRTISDIKSEKDICYNSLLEAIQYKNFCFTNL